MADNAHSEVIEGATSEWDEDGFHLHIQTDEEEYDLRIVSVEAAKTFLSAAYRLRSWIADADSERAAYNASSQEERDRVLGMRRYDPEEAALEAADNARKRARENPS